jgi:hypothetical protein
LIFITVTVKRRKVDRLLGERKRTGYCSANARVVILKDWTAMFNRPLMDERNNFRMPVYYRLDVSYQSNKATKRENRCSWIFSLYNAYNRLNPYLLYESLGRLKQYTLFPIIPSVTYRLEF